MSDTTTNSLLASQINQLGLGVPTTDKKSKSSLDQQQFFELMITQLKNQDPLSPMDSNQFLTQLAQFASVSGINNMEQSISNLATSMQSNQALQASALVGRDVLVPSSVAPLTDASGVSGAVDLSTATGDLNVLVTDPAGSLVRRIDVGPQQAGTVNFTWDGLRDDGSAATPGNYVLDAVAQDAGQNQALPVMVRSRVDSVTLSKNPPGVTLNVRGVGAVNVNDIKELL